MENHIGVDFHMQYSSVAVANKEGDIVDERKLYHTDEEALVEYFSSFDNKTPIALEATRNWYWFVDLLQELDMDVKLVHAKKAKIIAESTIKTDKVDARILAHLNRCNFLPQAYIADKDIRHKRELLRFYMSLVKIRSSIKNRVHAVLAKHNIHHGFSDLFGRAGVEFLRELNLSPVFKMKLDGYLKLLEDLKPLILSAQTKIKKECEESAYAKHLVTIPGISYFSALVLAAEIADIKRFKSCKKLCSYAGLASTTHQSADKVYHGHIIKDSNKYIRYVLVEAVPHAVKKDPKLWAYYQNVLRKKGRGKAKISVAAKLLKAIYQILKNDTDYQIGGYRTKGKVNHNFQVNSKTKLGAIKAAL